MGLARFSQQRAPPPLLHVQALPVGAPPHLHQLGAHDVWQRDHVGSLVSRRLRHCCDAWCSPDRALLSCCNRINFLEVAYVFSLYTYKSVIEERMLVEHFGQAYVEYKKRTAMIVPFLL